MVGKSYIVSQLTKTLKKKEASSEDDVEKHCCDRQCCDHNISEMKKNKNSNFFAMNEMVSLSSCFLIKLCPNMHCKNDEVSMRKPLKNTNACVAIKVIIIKACSLSRK